VVAVVLVVPVVPVVVPVVSVVPVVPVVVSAGAQAENTIARVSTSTTANNKVIFFIKISLKNIF
jgi:hypothetical protein